MELRELPAHRSTYLRSAHPRGDQRCRGPDAELVDTHGSCRPHRRARRDRFHSRGRRYHGPEPREGSRNCLSRRHLGGRPERLAPRGDGGRHRRRKCTTRPGDVYTRRTDVWPLVDLLRARRAHGVLRIRAYAELGSGRHLRSPNNRAWIVDPSLTSVVPGRPAGWLPKNRAGPGDEPNYYTGVHAGWHLRP